MKNMGVNTIRLEGHIMPPGFFEQMDQAGILVNAGYQCCDALAVRRQQAEQPRRLQDHGAVRADHRAGTAQPPQRGQLPVERQPADPQAGGRVAGRLPAGRLPGPADLLGRVQDQPEARAGRGEGRALRLGAAQLLVQRAVRQARLDPDQRGRRVGLRQRGERRGHHPHPRLAAPVHVGRGPVGAVAEPPRQPVPRQLRAALRQRATPSARCATSTPRCAPGTAPGPA